MTQTRPKTDELLDRLNSEMLSGRCDEFVLRRLERDANAVLKAPDSEVRNSALVVLGVIAGLRFDVAGARKLFEQALAASGNSPVTYRNYAALLGTLGLSDEGLDYVELGLAKTPADPDLLRLGLKLASNAFQIPAAEGYAQRLQSMKVLDADPETERTLKGLLWQKELLEWPDVSPDAVRQRSRAGTEIARRHKIRIAEERCSASSRGFLIEWLVLAEDDEVAAMNAELVSSIASLEPDGCDAAASFGFAPLLVAAENVQ